MPSGYLHLCCARLSASHAHVVQSKAFALGAQCPDPLFTLGIFPLRLDSMPKPYAKMLHTTRTGPFLTKLCTLALDRTDVEKSFAMGYLTHYALDSTVHPYVYAHSLTAGGSYSSALHMRLEKNWDALYRGRSGEKGRPESIPCVKEASACWGAVAKLLSDATFAVYPENPLRPEEIIKAFGEVETVNRLTGSRPVYYLSWGLENLLRKPLLLTAQFVPRQPMRGDIENNGHTPWRSLAEPDRVRREGLTELFEAAVQRSSGLLSAASAFFKGEMPESSLSAVIGNVGYDTGIESLP